jgi:hypothetical protein
MKWVLIACLSVAVLSACGDRGRDTMVACSAVLADGVRTMDLDHQPQCIGATGHPRFVNSHRWVCTDNRELFVNDYGYGVNGEPWHADREVIAQRLGTRGPGTPIPGTPLGSAVKACQPETH